MRGLYSPIGHWSGLSAWALEALKYESKYDQRQQVTPQPGAPRGTRSLATGLAILTSLSCDCKGVSLTNFLTTTTLWRRPVGYRATPETQTIIQVFTSCVSHPSSLGVDIR